jgi:hypothetical protein
MFSIRKLCHYCMEDFLDVAAGTLLIFPVVPSPSKIPCVSQQLRVFIIAARLDELVHLVEIFGR